MWTCNTCGSTPCVNPSFCSACKVADRKHVPDEYDARLRRLLADKVSFERAYYIVTRPALNVVESTRQAIAWKRKYGPKA